ncbi:hypothetical protein Ddc_19206 [Ditylenchus destructor]|nr:hypothetical protein Ddc_19206 [Ditylenchus destructor]
MNDLLLLQVDLSGDDLKSVYFLTRTAPEAETSAAVKTAGRAVIATETGTQTAQGSGDKGSGENSGEGGGTGSQTTQGPCTCTTGKIGYTVTKPSGTKPITGTQKPHKPHWPCTLTEFNFPALAVDLCPEVGPNLPGIRILLRSPCRMEERFL